jgi:hypothetical protein
MPLSKEYQTIWQKARAAGSGDQGVGLDDSMCGYVVALIVHDLGLRKNFPQIPDDFFTTDSFRSPFPFPHLAYETLAGIDPDSVTYFSCLARLFKSRLKYSRILSTQPFPTLDQVGPRGLLQYGNLSPTALTAFLFWRKWFMDVDNRSGQETGYLFEPLIAAAVGGVPFSATKSPVRSHRDGKGRQVDCLLEVDGAKNAYEFKVRVTIAASGQGRWGEELDFPVDCKSSGYRPVLVCLDGTTNPKLTQLVEVFKREGGEAFIGDAAWQHLDSLAGKTMSKFLDRYVREPLNRMIAEETPHPLPDMVARDHGNSLSIFIGDEELRIQRHEEPSSAGSDELPPDSE